MTAISKFDEPNVPFKFAIEGITVNKSEVARQCRPLQGTSEELDALQHASTYFKGIKEYLEGCDAAAFSIATMKFDKTSPLDTILATHKEAFQLAVGTLPQAVAALSESWDAYMSDLHVPTDQKKQVMIEALDAYLEVISTLRNESSEGAHGHKRGVNAAEAAESESKPRVKRAAAASEKTARTTRVARKVTEAPSKPVSTRARSVRKTAQTKEVKKVQQAADEPIATSRKRRKRDLEPAEKVTRTAKAATKAVKASPRKTAARSRSIQKDTAQTRTTGKIDQVSQTLLTPTASSSSAVAAAAAASVPYAPTLGAALGYATKWSSSDLGRLAVNFSAYMLTNDKCASATYFNHALNALDNSKFTLAAVAAGYAVGRLAKWGISKWRAQGNGQEPEKSITLQQRKRASDEEVSAPKRRRK